LRELGLVDGGESMKRSLSHSINSSVRGGDTPERLESRKGESDRRDVRVVDHCTFKGGRRLPK